MPCKPCTTKQEFFLSSLCSDLPALKERNTRARCVSSKTLFVSWLLLRTSVWQIQLVRAPLAQLFTFPHCHYHALIDVVTHRQYLVPLPPRARLILLFNQNGIVFIVVLLILPWDITFPRILWRQYLVLNMATPAALLPATPMSHAPPMSIAAAVNSSSPATLSSSPSVTPAGQSIFRSELLSSASPGITIGSLPHKPVYSTPSPVENTPQNNECKMVEVRGAKLASFTVNGNELICLPQAFDLFLKHLVGGLHTVYTKLKRLEITPVVCNVEQVRILRGLGAIQPGVNRCKLISRKDLEVLYNDCTNAR